MPPAPPGVYIAALPNHFNSEDARSQQRNTSVQPNLIKSRSLGRHWSANRVMIGRAELVGDNKAERSSMRAMLGSGLLCSLQKHHNLHMNKKQ